MPTLGNLSTWRTLYETNNRYYVNGVKISLLGDVTIVTGESIPKFNLASDFPQIRSDSIQYQDIARFKHFTDDWLIVDPEDSTIIGDVRYSLQANSTKPLWGIEVNIEQQNQHVFYRDSTRDVMSWDYIFNQST